MKMLKLTHAVLGGTKGDKVAEAYRNILQINEGLPLVTLHNVMHNVIMQAFSQEVKQYARANYKVEAYVVDDMLNELQTYNYL
jgi:hypothetical protein